MEISAIYIALCALLYIVLSWHVVKQRMKFRVAIGDGKEELLTCAIRVQGNASEYMPIALLLLVALEVNWNQPWLIHLMGSLFFISRIAHAYGLARTSGTSKPRFFGTLGTWGSIVAMAFGILIAQFV